MKRVLEVVGSCVGIVSACVGIYVAPTEIRVVALWGLFILILSIGAYVIYPLIKKRAAVFPMLVNASSYVVRHATKNDLYDIAQLQKLAYSKEDAVPIDLYKEWYEVNPGGFFVLKDVGSTNENEIVGHITFLSIKDERLELYRKGLIWETEIRGCDLIPASSKSDIKNVYVESVIITRKHRRAGVPYMYRALREMLCAFCDPSVVENIYAIAATDDGAKTLKRMGFTVIDAGPNSKRVDGHDMFVSNFREFLSKTERIESELGVSLINSGTAMAAGSL